MLLGLIAVLVNLVVWHLMVFLQNRDVLSGLIRPRGGWNKPFSERMPHIQDYWTSGVLGDVIAVSLIDLAVVTAVFRGGVENWMLLCFPVGVVATVAFYKMATRPARACQGIDWWFLSSFPEGRLKIQVTVAGKLHLLYFGVQSAVAFIGVVLLFSRDMMFLEATVGLMGGLLYGVAFILDKRQKHF